jgi:glycosyltransferase involved in cell wall biosynthesis
MGMGRQAREVLTAWGADPRLIVDAPNAADAEGIERRLRDPRSTARAATLRSRFGNGRRIAIVPGRLVPLKGTSSILDVWGRLPRHVREQWRLIFLGDGPLDELVRGTEGPDVALAGKVGFEEMIDWYRAADLTIFPSLGDVWGLVVNESMACGTPTLCSVHAGCADDLISNGGNGFTFDPATPEAAVLDTVRALTHHRLDALGERARSDVSALTPERLAEGFRTAAGLGREEFAKRKGRLRRLPST